MIPYGRQALDDEDIAAVVATLKSDFLTQGPVVPAFEKKIAEYCGAHYALAVNSGTSALHIACLALGLGPGDTLWTSPISFVASANCALYCGAKVDFVDIDLATGNLCPRALEQKLIAAEIMGGLPKIIVPVHLAGQPCDMKEIAALGKKYGFKIIEDACHALGATYGGEPIGNCRYSDITVFSFHPVKMITTAEGGMALTNDPELAANMALFRSHGITKDPALMVDQSPAPWVYEQQLLGFNYRLSDVHAALGLSQMNRLPAFIQTRASQAERYRQALAKLPVAPLEINSGRTCSYHIFVVRVLDDAACSRRELFNHLRQQGVGVNVHYLPILSQPYFQKLGFDQEVFPNARSYGQQALTLPLFPGLSESDQRKVIEIMTDVLG